jgi:hypothetical protein
MKKINTNNYRVSKQIMGQGQTRQVVENFSSIVECKKFYSSISKDIEWDYYCEEEVIYQGTQFDANGNSIDTAPCWQRLY